MKRIKSRSRLARTIDMALNDDPYAKARFSELLQQAIKEAEALFDNPMKQYLLFEKFETQLNARKLPEIPDQFADNHSAQAYFGVFKTVLPESLANNDTQWIELAFSIDQLIVQIVAQYSLNTDQVEKEIRKQLLPTMFRTCQSVGAGIEQAKEIIERIVQIVRVGQENGH